VQKRALGRNLAQLPPQWCPVGRLSEAAKPQKATLPRQALSVLPCSPITEGRAARLSRRALRGEGAAQVALMRTSSPWSHPLAVATPNLMKISPTLARRKSNLRRSSARPPRMNWTRTSTAFRRSGPKKRSIYTLSASKLSAKTWPRFKRRFRTKQSPNAATFG